MMLTVLTQWKPTIYLYYREKMNYHCRPETGSHGSKNYITHLLLTKYEVEQVEAGKSGRELTPSMVFEDMCWRRQHTSSNVAKEVSMTINVCNQGQKIESGSGWDDTAT